jgi:hypothetical protein
VGEAKVNDTTAHPDDRATTSGSRPDVKGEPDVGDVVEGEVGSARLVEPSTIQDSGAARDPFPDEDRSDAGPAKDR